MACTSLFICLFSAKKLESITSSKQGEKMPFWSFLTDACKNPIENLHYLSVVFKKENDNFHRILPEFFLQVTTGR